MVLSEGDAHFDPTVRGSRSHSGERRGPHGLILAAIACAESLALFVTFRIAGPSVLALGACHLIALAAAVGITAAARTRGEDVTFLALGLLGGSVMGPVGFIGASLLTWQCAGPDITSPLVARWYERIALSTTVPADERLCEDVDVGRTLDPDAPVPESFPAVMRSGALDQRQAILGHIARRFDLAYLPTLKIALASPEPVLRVQAAAVAAHIAPLMRRRLRDRIDAASRAPGDPAEALTLLDDLSLLIDSGLLDAAERRHAEALVRRLGDSVLAAPSHRPMAFTATVDPALRARLAARLERLLIDRQRFGELRMRRTAARVQRCHPSARLRRLGTTPRTSEPVP